MKTIMPGVTKDTDSTTANDLNKMYNQVVGTSIPFIPTQKTSSPTVTSTPEL